MLNSAACAYKPYRQSMIDLHGLSLEDAKNFVFLKIKESYHNGIDSLIIIAGRGNHPTKDGVRGKIFTQTQSWLESDELKSFINKIKKNDGSYRVKIHSNPKYVSNFLPKKILDRVALVNSVKIQGIELIKEQSETSAQMLGVLGCLYFYGDGVQQNITEGIRAIKDAARQGDGHSQLLLGKMYEKGISGWWQSKPKIAMHWYERALKQEDNAISEEAKRLLRKITQMKKAVLQYDEETQSNPFFRLDLVDLNRLIEMKGVEAITLQVHNGSIEMLGKLGYLYLKGLFVEKNPLKGLGMLQKAASDGDSIAQLVLGSMYANGTTYIKSNPTKAMYWYSKAQKQEKLLIRREANFLMGVAYHLGRGAPQNDEEAIKFLGLAANDGHHIAQINLAYIYSEGVNIKNEIKYQDNKMSTYWYLASAKAGNINAILRLAERFQKGLGTKQSSENALLWRKKAADMGDVEAQYLVGQHYEIGEGVDVNTDIAYAYYNRAFQQGHIGAQVRVGFILIQSKNLESQRLGIDLIKQAAKTSNDPDALCILSGSYQTGLPDVLRKNEDKAIKYLAMSAKLGCMPARNICISQFDLMGDYLAQEDVLFWLADAAKNGNQEMRTLIIDKLKDNGRNDLATIFKELVNPNEKKNKPRKKRSSKKSQSQIDSSSKNKAITMQFNRVKDNSKNNFKPKSLADSLKTLSLSKKK